jgi:uncharacterized protein (DUF2384 family)
MSELARQQNPPDAAVDDSTVVLKATIRAAERLKVNNRTLARIIGVSESSVSRMRKRDFPLEKGKSFELALMFIRLYRCLDAVVGGDDVVSAAWLANKNNALDGTPIDLIQTVPGLTNVIQYLDSRRAVLYRPPSRGPLLAVRGGATSRLDDEANGYARGTAPLGSPH